MNFLELVCDLLTTQVLLMTKSGIKLLTLLTANITFVGFRHKNRLVHRIGKHTVSATIVTSATDLLAHSKIPSNGWKVPSNGWKVPSMDGRFHPMDGRFHPMDGRFHPMDGRFHQWIEGSIPWMNSIQFIHLQNAIYASSKSASHEIKIISEKINSNLEISELYTSFPIKWDDIIYLIYNNFVVSIYDRVGFIEQECFKILLENISRGYPDPKVSRKSIPCSRVGDGECL